MHMRALLNLMVPVALLAGSAFARAPASAGPVALRPTPVSPHQGTADGSSPCVESYSNVAIPAGEYFPAGADVEVFDDLHLGALHVTDICAFDIGYFNGGAGLIDATVRFYSGSAEDDPPGALLATFALPGLPTGENFMHVEVPSTTLGQDTWMSVAFSAADAGLELANSPWPGASDDFFYMTPPGGFFTFGGNPRANFLVGVHAQGQPLAVGPGNTGLQMGFVDAPLPNPSRGLVRFRIGVPASGPVRVDVLDVAGRLVTVLTDGVRRPGVHSLSWSGRGGADTRAPSGVYFLRLQMPGFAASRKVVLLR
jgi:hypothetical protein